MALPKPTHFGWTALDLASLVVWMSLRLCPPIPTPMASFDEYTHQRSPNRAAGQRSAARRPIATHAVGVAGSLAASKQPRAIRGAERLSDRTEARVHTMSTRCLRGQNGGWLRIALPRPRTRASMMLIGGAQEVDSFNPNATSDAGITPGANTNTHITLLNATRPLSLPQARRGSSF